MTALDAGAIRRALEGRGGPVVDVVVHQVTGSTNDDARALLAAGSASGSLVVADAQRAGRGRGGNVWQSPPGENVYLSVALRAGAPVPSLPPFALVVGLVVAEVVATLAGVEAGLKWPNDVWVGRRKLAGVLVEALHRSATPPALVVGIGLNVAQTTFPAELPATSIALAGGSDVDRNVLVAHLADGVRRAFDVFEARGLAAFHARIAARDVLRGRTVAVEGVSGHAVGIAPAGALLVDTGGEVVPVESGHVELRD